MKKHKGCVRVWLGEGLRRVKGQVKRVEEVGGRRNFHFQGPGLRRYLCN